MPTLRRSCMLVAAAACLLPLPVLAHPGSGIAVDQRGQIFFLDTGSGPWKVDTQGKPTRLSRTLFHWLALDEANRFSNTRLPTGDPEILRVGASPTLLIASDYPIAIGEDGNLYLPSRSPRGLQIMRMVPSGQTSALATLPPTAKGPLEYINGIAAAPDGSIYYTEDSVIRRITAQGAVSTAATVTALADGPSVPGNDDHPYRRGLDVDAAGVMYVADSGDARVLKIPPGKPATTLVQLERPWAPTAVALSGTDLYAIEFSHTASDNRIEWMPRIRKIGADGKNSVILTVDQMPGAR